MLALSFHEQNLFIFIALTQSKKIEINHIIELTKGTLL